MERDVYALLDDLEIQINEGKKVPLTNQYVINRDSVLAAISAIRDNMPEAVKDANRIMEKKNQIKEEANNQYNNTIAEAEAKARALTLESKQRAEKTMTDAQNQADQLYADAERQANELVISAERKAKDLVAQTNIMIEADKEATRILTEARAEAQRDRMAAYDQCDELLKHAEDTAIAVANELRDARMSFDRER